jgi:Protein of unknown function (DUF2950)
MAGAWFVALALCATGCKKQPGISTPTQATYATPGEAGQALQNAVRSGNGDSLANVLGPKSQTLIYSGNPTEDKEAAQSFVTKYDRMNRWVVMTDGSRFLYVGADNYPFPIPVVKDSTSKWRFDPAGGEQELLARRIGKNELLAIDTTRAIANAEELYRKGSHGYNSALLSSTGKKDGLHWETVAGEAPSHLARLGDFAELATAHRTADGAPILDGYSFRILSAQGDKTRGEAKSYMANGQLAGGFAVVAAPVKYQDTGIMRFIINREGVVYQKDLGPQTASIAAAIAEYNPADGWTLAK